MLFRSGGGGGGVAAKVATAQRAANNQTEDLEQKHQDKLTQIEADAMQKRMQAEQAFHQSQTRGRIGFYAGLANVTAGSSANSNAVNLLGETADFSYNQMQMQTLMNKVDELLTVMRR